MLKSLKVGKMYQKYFKNTGSDRYTDHIVVVEIDNQADVVIIEEFKTRKAKWCRYISVESGKIYSEDEVALLSLYKEVEGRWLE